MHPIQCSRNLVPLPSKGMSRLSKLAGSAALVGMIAATACSDSDAAVPTTPAQSMAGEPNASMNPEQIAQGKTIFRFDTFGDETFWTDTLRMHEVIRTSVSPKAALDVGLKVDADALPAAVKAGILDHSVDLNAPATTVTLLKLGAVVGVIGQVDASNNLTRVGVTCALCHSTVDNSFAPGIG